MVHAVLFAADLRLVLCKRKRMGRDIYLRDNLDTQAVGELLEGDKLLFRIIAVAGGQSGESFAFEAESRIGLVPVMIVILLEGIIVQVDLERVHLVVSHHLHIIAQHAHRDKLTPAIHHKATDRIVGIIAGRPFRQSLVALLFGQLQQRAGSPIQPLALGSGNGDTVGDLHRVAFLPQPAVGRE